MKMKKLTELFSNFESLGCSVEQRIAFYAKYVINYLQISCKISFRITSCANFAPQIHIGFTL